MKKSYKATVTMIKNGKTWNVVVYAHYESFEKAVEGLAKFYAMYADMIVNAWIEAMNANGDSVIVSSWLAVIA